jgi:hypothetical protein
MTLLVSALACGLLAVYASTADNGLYYSNSAAIVTSGAAAVLSAQIIVRQKIKEQIPQLYLALGIAAGLWFAAETIWAYYELVAAIEMPFPSLADAFWLAGYAPFFFFLHGIFRTLAGLAKIKYSTLILIASASIAVLAYVMISIHAAADLSSQQGMIIYMVSVAYPIADMVVMIPLVVIFVQLRKGKLLSTPWAYLLIGSVLFLIADVGFAYFSVQTLDDAIWIWNPLYNVGYIAIAASLFWHRNFFTVDEKKLLREWQEKNR